MWDSIRRAFFPVAMIFILSGVTLTMAATSSRAADLQQIKPEELKKLMESKDPNILVVDTQPERAYALGHIKGAINFPWRMDIKSPGTLPRDKTLILYCDCAPGEDSANLADQLTGKSGSCPADDDSTDVAVQLMSKFGYRDIKLLEGGWSRWQELGYPVDK